MYVGYGVPSNALLQWLQKDCGPIGMRKMFKSIDLHLTDVHR